tara:strand:- start:572 stop:856 length:285 start_codon:yes stop_codon:yes gene_type:complete
LNIIKEFYIEMKYGFNLMSEDEYQYLTFPDTVQHLTAFGNEIKFGRIDRHTIYAPNLRYDNSIDKIEIYVDDEGDVDVSIGYFLDKRDDMRCIN